jgi:lipoprotein-releasing system permease protein
VDPFTVAWVVAGAVAIAVLASVLPAERAARLHPVQALRYE